MHHILPLIKKKTCKHYYMFRYFLRFDYCKSVLYGDTESKMNRLQRDEKALASVACTAPYRALTSGAGWSLH